MDAVIGILSMKSSASNVPRVVSNVAIGFADADAAIDRRDDDD